MNILYLYYWICNKRYIHVHSPLEWSDRKYCWRRWTFALMVEVDLTLLLVIIDTFKVSHISL